MGYTHYTQVHFICARQWLGYSYMAIQPSQARYVLQFLRSRFSLPTITMLQVPALSVTPAASGPVLMLSHAL